MVGSMRIILAVIVTAVAISILIDSPRRELAAQLRANWQEYRQHVGGPRVSATSENFPDSLEIRLDTER
jgi:hypothetical protein